MVTLRNDPIKDYMEFDKAIETAIIFLKARRKLIEVPIERYTMY